MEDNIDLDLAARAVRDYQRRRRDQGIVVGDLTWRDGSDQWPAPLRVDRAEVKVPYSIGVECSKGLQEGRVVLYRGGWADLEYWSGSADDEPIVEAPGWGSWLSIEALVALLDRFGALFD